MKKPLFVKVQVKKSSQGGRSFYITIPKTIAKELQITEGDYLLLEVTGDSIILRKAIIKPVGVVG